MVFKRLLGSLGVGGPTVDTVLDPGAPRPGAALTGQVHLKGGDADFDIEHITLELVARVEAEHEEGESEGVVAFERFTVGGGFRLGAGEPRSVPFTVALPWETPVTDLHGQDLGIVLGVRTELAVAGARDKGDLDRLSVGPLPVQEAILAAFGALGFGFRSADSRTAVSAARPQRLHRVVAANNQEIARYDLSEDASTETAMVFGELYRNGAEWKFRAGGQGYASGLAGIAADFGVGV
ncbi:hypothetical protein SHIRM173S_13090 [Streptomyces hirsutus]